MRVWKWKRVGGAFLSQSCVTKDEAFVIDFDVNVDLFEHE
jgi:hypothetical protein